MSCCSKGYISTSYNIYGEKEALQSDSDMTLIFLLSHLLSPSPPHTHTHPSSQLNAFPGAILIMQITACRIGL